MKPASLATMPLAKGSSTVCAGLSVYRCAWPVDRRLQEQRSALGAPSAAEARLLQSFREALHPSATPAVLGYACAWSVVPLQFGGAEEYAALAGLFPSKTSAAPPSKADLAAMGEDFEGLSREEMLRRIDHPRPSPASEPLCNGKAWNTEAAGNPRVRAPRALHGPPIAPAPRVLA